MPRLAFVFLLFFTLAAAAQEPGETHKRITSLVDDRNYLAAIAELQKLKTERPAVFDVNNYSYLLARLADRTGDVATAVASYQAVATTDSVLKEYAIWHMAQIARGAGNLLLERTYLQQITEFSTDSLLAPPARMRLAQSWFESGNYGQTIKLLSSPQWPQPTSNPKLADQAKRRGLVLLGDSYYKFGDQAKAREIYTRLVTELANAAQPDDFALAGAKGLDLLDGGNATWGKSTAISDYEHLRRASIYQFNRDFADARLHYAAIIENFPTSGIVPDAIFQIGRGYAQNGNFTEAVSWFERVQEQYPDHPVNKDALQQAASAYARIGKHRESVARYRKFIDAYPDDERLDRAYLNIIDTLRDNREDTEALKWAAKTEEVYKGKLPEALALFSEARIHTSRSDWQNALATLERLQTIPNLGGAPVPGGTNLTEVGFLRGLSLENLGRFQEAIDVYLSIPDGRNEYYGGRATERLRLLAGSETARKLIDAKLISLASPSTDKESERKNLQAAVRLTVDPENRSKKLESLKKVYAELPAYRNIPRFELLKIGRQQVRAQNQSFDAGGRGRAIADELLFLGLYDEAGPEVEAAYKPKETASVGAGKTDLDYTIATIHNRGNRADRTAAFIEPLWKMPADFQVELIPADIAAMLFPVPYADLLIKYAPQRDVDPRFLLSIMRQESRFRADVKSNAAARGLMQFISSTSTRIAAELGRENFRQDDLYDPATAILFGSQYLGNLFKIFPRQPAAVAASYNGGEDNVARWMARSKSDSPDRYVPEIVFSQSKDYAYRVMANYRVYQSLYDANLKMK
jgi:soluble lytic murein transglycosylase